MEEYFKQLAEKVESEWSKLHGDKGWGRSRPPEKRFIDFLNKYEKQIGPKVLDVGSGDGQHLLPLAQRGFVTTGVELTEEGIDITNKKLTEEGLKATLIKGDHHSLDLEDESFDTVVSIQTFQFNDLNGFGVSMKEASRVLKPGGLFFLRVRSTNRPYGGIVLDKNGKIYRRGFKLEEIEAIAKDNGLEIIEEPVDARKEDEKGNIKETGQWNIVLRKKKVD